MTLSFYNHVGMVVEQREKEALGHVTYTPIVQYIHRGEKYKVLHP